MSFAARAQSARAANDTTRAQINNIPEKSHVIPLLLLLLLLLLFSFNLIRLKWLVIILFIYIYIYMNTAIHSLHRFRHKSHKYN